MDKKKQMAKKMKKSEDKPESGVVYALTGGKGQKAISNGNSWAESRIHDATKGTNKTRLNKDYKSEDNFSNRKGE